MENPLNNCVGCKQPIPSGQEKWVRRKSTNERVPLCAKCAHQLYSTVKTQQAQQQPTDATQTEESPRNEPSSKITSEAPITGILIAILMMFIGAPLLGGIVAYVGQFIYLIFGFPIIAGVASGFIMAQGIRWGKIRDSVIAATLGLLIGLCTYGSYRCIEYLIVRNDVQTSIMKEFADSEDGPIDSATAAVLFDYILLEETGQTGFIGFVLLEAKEGMSISRRGTGPSLNVGTTLTWVYWLIEAFIYAGVPAAVALKEADKPFCKYHNRWYKKKRLGSIEKARAEEMMSLLAAHNYVKFRQALRSQVPVPRIEF